MSAIAGVLELNGKPVASQLISRMLAAVPSRCRDGVGVWCEDDIGLGHGSLLTKTEPPSYNIPVTRGDLVLTFDARIDNSEDLCATLGLGAKAADAVLILDAYRRWGEDCPAYLLGDFAFAIWDKSRRALFCARDHFGVKPFYFYEDDERFIFASEIKSLFAVDCVGRAINEPQIADFLIGLSTDEAATLYQKIRRLPPAHTLSVTADRRAVRRFWRLTPNPPANQDDRAAQFRELFSSAVRCRLKDVSQPAAMLSGGLDSSAITCFAARILRSGADNPLPTFSLVFDGTPSLNERPYIEAVLAQGHFRPTFIASDDYPVFADLADFLEEQQGVVLAPALPLSRQLYYSAANAGARVLLNGHGGDEVVSYGYGRLQELARAGHWLALGREIRALAKDAGQSPLPMLWPYLRRYTKLALFHRMYKAVHRSDERGWVRKAHRSRTRR